MAYLQECYKIGIYKYCNNNFITWFFCEYVTKLDCIVYKFYFMSRCCIILLVQYYFILETFHLFLFSKFLHDYTWKWDISVKTKNKKTKHSTTLNFHISPFIVSFSKFLLYSTSDKWDIFKIKNIHLSKILLMLSFFFRIICHSTFITNLQIPSHCFMRRRKTSIII